MADNSAIEWTEATWNPLVGCRKVSPGCAHCYAETMAKRLAAMALADQAAGKDPGRKARYLEVIDQRGRWNNRVATVPEALADPLRWRRPRRVFVNSMSDLFHEDVPLEFVDQVFAVMALTSHTYQVLTKRPERMAEYLLRPQASDAVYAAMEQLAEAHGIADFLFDELPLPNVLLGTSCENQETADRRLPHLLRCPAAQRFVSAEPLLGPIDFGRLVHFHEGFSSPEWQAANLKRKLLHWIIVGGESGHGARPCNLAWIRGIRDQCKVAGVPVFVKQLGSVIHARDVIDPIDQFPGEQISFTQGPDEHTAAVKLRDPKGGDWNEWPEDLRVRQFTQLTAKS